jgi:hypothetical protein
MDRNGELIIKHAREFIWIVVLVALLAPSVGFSQAGVITFGVQLKPIVPNKFMGTASETYSNDKLTCTLNPKAGYAMGMVLRRGLSKNWSFETGINYVRRNYNLKFEYSLLEEPQELNYRFIGYEIPLQALVYVRLGNNTWMNAAGGASIDFYPSDIIAQKSVAEDSTFYNVAQKTFRRRWAQVSLLANYGFEYRTRDKGYWYAGISYHRPFRTIAITRAYVLSQTETVFIDKEINGSYLTIDLRYFFHEKATKQKPKPSSP